MSANSLKNNINNPARSYLWEVLMPNPVSGDPTTLLLRCRSSNIPGVSVGSIHLPFKQTGGVKYPGKKTFSHTWACTFVESEDRKTWEAFYQMAQAIIDAETGIGAFGIKRDVYLHLIDQDDTVSLRIKMVGVYVESQDDVALAHSDEGELNIAITFSYDYWVKA